MKAITKLAGLSLLCASLATTSLSAKECININKADVNWTSYKTLAKVGVSGTFKNVDLTTIKNASTIKKALKNTSVKINLDNIDAKADIKTNNILKFFVPNLSTKQINAKIVEIYDNSLKVQITLNGKTQTIPMKYKNIDNTINANGVIDALDFDLASALKVLNTNVAGHLNKGWYDIPVSFTLAYTNTCK